MVRRDTEADEAPGRGQALQQIDLDPRLLAREEMAGGVEGGRPRADDGDAQGSLHEGHRAGS